MVNSIVSKSGKIGLIAGFILGLGYILTNDVGFIVGCVGSYQMVLTIEFGERILKKLEDKQ